MANFRNILIGMTALVLVFTITAIAQGGINLITPFVMPILSMAWPGQFHVDFTCYLVLSALWLAWRQGFSRAGLALAVFGAPLGMLFFAPYLIFLIGQTGGDANRLLLGVHAAGQSDGS